MGADGLWPDGLPMPPRKLFKKMVPDAIIGNSHRCSLEMKKDTAAMSDCAFCYFCAEREVV